MSNTNTGGPVFPTLPEHGFNYGMPGMTLRDYFAAKAMQAILPSYAKTQEKDVAEEVSHKSFFMADAMLKAREA